VSGIERLSTQGLALDSFRGEALRRLRSSMSIDAAFFATVDPMTLMFTSALAEAPLAAVTAQFLDNEYGTADVNKFARLAAAADPVGSLDQATNGDRSASARYRDVLAPNGLGDELRVALVTGGSCWGVLCLHRSESPAGFDPTEVDFVRRVAPLLAAGLRRTVALHPATPDTSNSSGPGIIIIDADLKIVSINPRAESFLADIIDADWPSQLELPAPVHAVAARFNGDPRTELNAPITTRLRQGGGGWITVNASSLDGTAGRQIALVLDETDPVQSSSLLLAAHGLTPAQTRVVALVVQGRSTPSIVNELHISTNTLQEHLHAVFDKLGIGSRRELVAALSPRRPH
jgi:DNA-binding CsgD family transcriptional regulator